MRSLLLKKKTKTIKYMCWYTFYKACLSPKIAENDMTVLKVLRTDSDGYLSGPFYRYKYELGKQNEYVQLICNNSEIKNGYHSFELCENAEMTDYSISLHYANKPKITWVKSFLSETLYKCIIPKGTKYYLNEGHNIVSETIIVKEPYDKQKIAANNQKN